MRYKELEEEFGGMEMVFSYLEFVDVVGEPCESEEEGTSHYKRSPESVDKENH